MTDFDPFSEQEATPYEKSIRELKKQGVSLFVGEFWYIGSSGWKKDLIFANDYFRKIIET
jgi:L-ribulose-5-phosphate 3-epimerase